jgi:hypothetical protein
LFLGYAYAQGLDRFVAVRWQPWVHGCVLLAAVASLPVLPDVEWKPDDPLAPTGCIFAMLAANVGLPFLFLAAAGPLIQAWFVRAAPLRTPWVLYAVSNAGSFLALLSYPFLIEPALPLSTGSSVWSACLVALGVLVLVCGALAARSASHRIERTGASEAAAERDPWLVYPTERELASARRFTDDYSDVFRLLKSRANPSE